MITLRKVEEPDILQQKGGEWLQVLQDKIDANEVPTNAEKTRYGHPQIKEALIRETHGKCAYCESYLLHVTFGDVEHISPKSKRLDDTFRWFNLTLACDVCNTYKSDSIDLIDPYVDQPDEVFRFFGPMIYARPDNAKGVATLKKLQLNRPALIERRTRKLDSIYSLVMILHSADNPQIKAVLAHDLRVNEVGDDQEYAAFVRHYLASLEDDIDLRPPE